MSNEQERIAVLETKVENLEDWIKTVDGRLRSVENNMRIGIGILIAANVIIQFLFK